MRNLNLLLLPQSCVKTGDSRSAFYLKIKQRLMTPGVRLSARSVGWPEHELNAILSARIAGKTDDQIRDLVAELTADRKRATTDR